MARHSSFQNLLSREASQRFFLLTGTAPQDFAGGQIHLSAPAFDTFQTFVPPIAPGDEESDPPRTRVGLPAANPEKTS
jgi:hypothetical protein